jgi:hypothetical protein
MDPFQQVQAAIDQIPVGEKQLDSAIKLFREHGRVRDRSLIVKCVVWLYVLSIGAGIAYLVSRGMIFGENRFTDVFELIKVAVVPILTLVVGYYFGTEQR